MGLIHDLNSFRTGTPIGDPIEVRAIGNVFSSERSSEPLLIGSVLCSILMLARHLIKM